MSSVGISGNIFVNGLNTNLDSCATVGQHIREMTFLTEIRSCFNSDTDAFLFALLRKLDGLLDVR